MFSCREIDQTSWEAGHSERKDCQGFVGLRCQLTGGDVRFFCTLQPGTHVVSETLTQFVFGK